MKIKWGIKEQPWEDSWWIPLVGTPLNHATVFETLIDNHNLYIDTDDGIFVDSNNHLNFVFHDENNDNTITVTGYFMSFCVEDDRGDKVTKNPNYKIKNFTTESSTVDLDATEKFIKNFKEYKH